MAAGVYRSVSEPGGRTHLEGGVDAADECVQDVDVLVAVEEDEGEEGLQEGRLRHAPQEQVQIRCGGHHLLQGELARQTHLNR